MLKIIELPGFADIEAKILLGFSPNHPVSPELDQSLNALSLATFGITADDVEFPAVDNIESLPQAAQDEAIELEWQMGDFFDTIRNSDEDAVDLLRTMGVDFSDARGWPIRCTQFFKWQAFAAAIGMAGRLPDQEAMRLRSIESRLEAQVRAFVEGRRSRG